jgi:hypothetical protein
MRWIVRDSPFVCNIFVSHLYAFSVVMTFLILVVLLIRLQTIPVMRLPGPPVSLPDVENTSSMNLSRT